MKQAVKREAEPARVRVDVWLWRARFCKTRAAASRLVTEGGVRVIRDNLARRLDKASATLACGDRLVFPNDGAVQMVRIKALGVRRGPPAEARALYMLLDAQGDVHQPD